MVLVLACGAATSPLLAQEGGTQTTPTPPPQSGLQIRSVSAYAGYDSSFLPNGVAGFQPGSASLPADEGFGGSVVLEWTKFTERSSFSLNYTPSYTGYVQNSSLNALNHALSLTSSRKIAPRWNFSFSTAGNLSTMEQSAFSPTPLSTVASLPATFSDLAAGILSANFTNNPQLGAVLTSSPLLQSPVTNLIYGQRMLTASAHTSLSYSFSPRLSLTFSGGGDRTQYISQNQTLPASSLYVIPNTTSGNAGVGISYSLSPFTQVGGTVATTLTASSIYEAYTTTSLATLGHSFGTRWLMQTHGGVGFNNPVRQTSSVGAVVGAVKPGLAAGGSLAYKIPSHTLLGSYDRSVSDQYGLGASTSSSATASWHWRRPGSFWWLDSGFTWQLLQGGALTNTSGWRATASLARAIGTHVVLLTQYVYSDYSGGLLLTSPHVTQNAVRVSVVWTPRPSAIR